MKTTRPRSGYKSAIFGVITPDRVILTLIGLIAVVIITYVINNLSEEIEFLEYNSPESTIQYPVPY